MTSKKTPYQDSVLGTNLWWLRAVIRFILAMMLFSIIAIILDIIYFKYVWGPDRGIERMESLIAYAFEYPLNQVLAEKCAEATYWIYFKWNLIDEAVRNYANGEIAPTIISRTYRNTLIIPFQSEMTVAMYGTKLFGIRMASMLQALPLLALTGLVAIVDGLVERYVRTKCVGNESSTIYHRAKFYAFRLVPPAAGLIYLAAPYAINPALIFIPTALLMGILLRTQMKYYKKYL